jgi:DNA helicase-2/ATP-dependent DNA helicase PcrA
LTSRENLPAWICMSRDYVLQPFSAPIEPKINYAGELNEQQLAAVTAPPGPALVIAGAGSGKTRALTYRAAFLLEQGIPPERILLLTFTNKAAKEMMRRVTDLIGGELSQLWGGTFHSIGARVLRAPRGVGRVQAGFFHFGPRGLPRHAQGVPGGI